MTRSFASLTLLLLALAATGCGSPATPPAATGDHAAAPAEGKVELTEADQALIEKQKLCLVADEPLGSMGTPIKVTVQGRDVFLCCEGCRDAVLKNPEKYLAKLDENGTVIVAPEAAEEPKPDTAAPSTEQ